MTKLSNREEVDRAYDFMLGQLAHGPIEWECKRWRKKRSNEQNAYLWRAIYQPLVEVAGHTKDHWHEYFCGERWGWVEEARPGGRTETRPARTTTTGLDGKKDVLSSEDFAAFVKFLEAQVADMGVFVVERWQP